MKKVMDGNTACADIAYKFSEIASIYPITPSSPMAEHFEEKKKEEEKNIFGNVPEIIEMQSEAGAAGCMHGALLAGSLSVTFTSSQGLLLMIPNMYKMAGEELPGVVHVAARTIATHALSIFGDHQDVYAVRDTGFCIIASSSVQEAHDLAAVSHLSSISSSLPFLHFFDGFRTSHEINVVDVIDTKDLIKMVNKNALKEFKNRAMNINNPIIHGTNQNEDIYFQSIEARNKDYEEAVSIISSYFNEINKLQNTSYAPFNYYGHKDATNIIIAMGSVSKTIKDVAESLSKKGVKIGFVEVHLYRPFSTKHLKKVIPASVKKIVVLDRAKMPGASGEALYEDVCASLSDLDVNIYGGRYGIGGKNTSLNDIISVYKQMENEINHDFTIGIIDDVTNKSLKKSEFRINKNVEEILICGYGSDGMVSASKELLKLYHEDTGKYVQGYFQYDSKKSSGLTRSHLRFSKEKIEMPYYLTHPGIVVVTKDDYLNTFRVTRKIKQNGILIINTDKKFNDLIILSEILDDLRERNITIFTIDADSLSSKNGIKGKNGIIFEAIILKLLGCDNYIEMLTSSVKKRFATLGKGIINANERCIKEATNYLKEYTGFIKTSNNHMLDDNIYEMITARYGDKLKVSDLLKFRTGEFKTGTSKLDNKSISKTVPKWISENCVQCGMCASICPHATIRPFIVDKDEYDKGIPLLGDKLQKYNYVIEVDKKHCTGCKLCVNICPSKDKALVMEQNDKKFDQGLFYNYTNPMIYDKFSIKGSSLLKCNFEFSGACAGCGQTPYLNILTKLFGDKMIIANATGCSSIYGGMAPFIPYKISWVNSLFEDNAEAALGLHLGYKNKRKRIITLMKKYMDKSSDIVKELYKDYILNNDDYETTKKVGDILLNEDIPKSIKSLKDYFTTPTVWAVGGDGWAYDIGFSGIDHVLASGENIKILILDTEVYSNTGGQSSKSSPYAQVSKFSSTGKNTNKKDLFRFATMYDNVYVAQTSIGANIAHTIKVFKEADQHVGPALIICYSPCIEHGISKGMSSMADEQLLAVEAGYFMLMRYKNGKLKIDSKKPNFDKYDEFLENEVRFSSLKMENKEKYKEMLLKNKKYAMEKYKYYENLVKFKEFNNEE